MTRNLSVALVTDYNPVLLRQFLINKSSSNGLFQPSIVENNYLNLSIAFEDDFDSVPNADVALVDLRLDTVCNYCLRGPQVDCRSIEDVHKTINLFLPKLYALCEKSEYVLLNHISPSIFGQGRTSSLTYTNPSDHLLCLEFVSEVIRRTQDIKNLIILHSQHLEIDYKSLFRLDCPYPYVDLQAFARRVLDSLNLLYREPPKVICLDLDDTLWGGTLGEDGKDRLELGGLSHRGKAYAFAQRYLRYLKGQGFLLAIASKNTEEIAIDALDTHPEMVLRSPDFSSFRIGWSSKAESIDQIAKELNLPTSSFIFIDDNQRELEEVRNYHPDIQILRFNGDPIVLVTLLSNEVMLRKMVVSSEDLTRSDDYQLQSKRNHEIRRFNKDIRSNSTAKLLEVSITPCNFITNFDRCMQLLNKTNQFNAVSQRYTAKSLLEKANAEGVNFVSYKAHDKFGAYGLIAVASFVQSDHLVIIEDFVVSCRAIGRGVEEAILIHLNKSVNAPLVKVLFRPNPRNQPVQEFYEKYQLIDQNGSSIQFPRIKLTEILSIDSAKIEECM